MRNDPFAPHFIKLLEAHGIRDYTFVRGAKHPRLVINHDGVTRIYAYPGTTGDRRRAPLNAVSDLKHLLGLHSREQAPKAQKARRHQKPRHQAAPGPTAARPTQPCSVEDRYYSRLEELRRRLFEAEAPAADLPASLDVASAPPRRPRQRLRCAYLGLNRVRYQEQA